MPDSGIQITEMPVQIRHSVRQRASELSEVAAVEPSGALRGGSERLFSVARDALHL